MKKILISMFALAGAFLWGCEEPNEEIDYSTQDLKIAATIQQSRTTVSASSVAWAAGDEILLICENEEYAFTTAQSGESAEFTSEAEITPATIKGSALVAYYGCNSLGAFNLPQSQNVKGGVNETKVPMYAYTAEAPDKNVLAMTFQPAASVLEVVFGSKNISVESITLAPAAGAMITGGLCGTFNVNALTNKVTSKNALESITVTFDESKNLENGLSVQIPIGWCTITGGLKLSISYNDGNFYEDVIWANETVATFNEKDGVQSYKYFVTEVEIDLGPRDWYVKADGDANSKGRTWAGATTLSNALVNAAEGSTIHVAAGTYVPVNYILGNEDLVDARKTFEVSKAMTIIGGYPANAAEGATADAAANKTILDGGATAYHTLLVTSPDKVVIEGITIQNGDNSTAPALDAEAGTGFVTSSVNKAIIEDKSGAGLYVAASKVELKNCVVCNNKGTQAAGVYSKDAELTVVNTTVDGNTNVGNGAGIWVWNGTVTIEGSTISNNGDETTDGVGRGLYVYGEAEKSAKATVKNTTISGNLSGAKGNNAGFYIRGENETANVEATFTNCTIKENVGNMGGGGGGTHSKVTLDNCDLTGNVGKGNGVFYFMVNVELNVINSRIIDNVGQKNALFYLYSNAATGDVKVNIVNSVFKGNQAVDRGSVMYVRSDVGAAIDVTCVNTTFTGQNGGTVVHLYAKGDAKVKADLISCTIAGNNITGTKAKGSTLSEETAATTINLYNTIVAGNTQADGTDLYKHASGVVAYQNSVLTSAVYGADGAVVEGKSFDATALGAYADGVLPLSNTSVAWTDGMAAADLYTVGSAINATIFTEDVMKKDQKGNARNGNVMGAYVGQ